ncbi:uncharacterized protein LOC112566454 isoform X2 [Pomacea canaliculata]|uniref:uncharacterized protein LOC112566454 isoform X2 n=1 Tax=Pomacea canaliculata TaxID=400727 RepID=UPI000D73D4FF|nr:uncharacterized protein LOC112566454 isoform X2 [Pomacea canaliculata]
MRRSTLADVLLTFLLVLEAETTSPSREGVAMRSANVISESGKDLLWSFMARSLVHCHLLCVGNDRCDGFTFARMSPTTQGWCQGWCRNPWQETSGSALAGAVSFAIKSRQFDLQQAATTQGQGFDLQDASTTQGQEFDTQETSTATQDENTVLYNPCGGDGDCPDPYSWMCHKTRCLCKPGYYYCVSRNECIQSCSSTILRSDLVTYEGLYLGDPRLDNATLNVDEYKCETYCSDTTDCRAFNFDTSANECQMVEEDMLLAQRDSFLTNDRRDYRQKMCC